MVIIIGGGAAGLACARTLHAAGVDFRLLEASDRLGGRLRTDVVDGFRLDHGFQIFLTSYPEARALLNYQRLGLRSFRSGARIHADGRWHELLNPLREGPGALPGALLTSVATVADKWRLARLAWEVRGLSVEELFAAPATAARDFLRGRGFSERLIRLFFQPFFGGVFLDRDLTTSSNLLRFTLQQFLQTDAALPALGIAALGTELAAPLPPARLGLWAPVAALDGTTVVLASGERLRATAVVLATDAATTARLLHRSVPEAWRATTVAYYAADTSPQAGDRLLALNAAPAALVHNVCVPSDVQPSYAPAGAALVSVSSHGPVAITLPDDALDARFRTELTAWYGPAVRGWRWLGAYRLPQALPVFGPEARPASLQPVQPGVWVAGDQQAYPSLNGALASGRQVAEALLRGA